MKVIRKPKLDPRLMTQTELIAYVHELKAENARLEEGYQKSLGVIAATDCVECKNEVDKLLYDYGIKDISTLEYILDQYQKVIVNITNNRMSYLTYPAETILSVVSDIYNENLEKAIDELNTELLGYRQNAIVFKPELMYTLKECEPKLEDWHNENPSCQNLQEIRYRAAKAEYDKIMKVLNGWGIKLDGGADDEKV